MQRLSNDERCRRRFAGWRYNFIRDHKHLVHDDERWWREYNRNYEQHSIRRWRRRLHDERPAGV